MNALVPQKAPHNLEAEQQVLAAILCNNAAYDRIGSFLRPDHFYFEPHRTIFKVASAVIQSGQTANPVTLQNRFSTDDGLKEVGGSRYLTELASMLVSVSDVTAYAETVQNLATRRAIIDAANIAIADAIGAEPETPAERLLEQAEATLAAAADSGLERNVRLNPLAVAVNSALQQSIDARTGKHIGLSTGLETLDGQFAGFERGNLYLLAGRPGMGKSALALSVGLNIAKAGDGVVFISLEMTEQQLGHRTLADHTGISHDLMRRGKTSDMQVDIMVRATGDLQTLPFWVKASGARTIGALRAEIRRQMRAHKVGLIIVDYLQILEAAGTYRGNKVAEISELSAGLKMMAKDFDVPVLALSQLNRSVESRDDKRPMLSDLRESGALEQDADAVMFVYREQYYLERAEPGPNDDVAGWKVKLEACRNQCQVLVAKQRQGPVGQVMLYFDAATNRFRDLHRGYE